MLADETPVLFCTDILPLDLLGGRRLDSIDFTRPIFEIAEQYCHVEVTETLTTVHAVQGTPAIRRQLGLKPEQALLQLDEICYSRTCKAGALLPDLLHGFLLTLRWCANWFDFERPMAV